MHNLDRLSLITMSRNFFFHEIAGYSVSQENTLKYSLALFLSP